MKKWGPNVLPYSRQCIDEEDIQAVQQVLRSDWLTTGPLVDRFESYFAKYVHAQHAVAVSSGTAALHAAMFALNIQPGDQVIVPAMTFAATANAVVFGGGEPVFADVDPDSLLIDPSQLEQCITSKTKAIVAVDYAGQPCDYEDLRNIADRYSLGLVADACHALGATYKNECVGTLADLSTFSFHPVKPITTGEGGMISTNDASLAQRMRTFRNHGITTDHRQRAMQGSWFYEMVDLGYNYRISDIQCALGISQLQRYPLRLVRRQEIAKKYDLAFEQIEGITPLQHKPHRTHAYHLYVIQIDAQRIGKDRATLFQALRTAKVGVNVHYIPVHLHPYYRQRFNTLPGMCPNAEASYECILSLPVFPTMNDQDISFVIEAVKQSIM